MSGRDEADMLDGGQEIAHGKSRGIGVVDAGARVAEYGTRRRLDG